MTMQVKNNFAVVKRIIGKMCKKYKNRIIGPKKGKFINAYIIIYSPRYTMIIPIQTGIQEINIIINIGIQENHNNNIIIIIIMTLVKFLRSVLIISYTTVIHALAVISHLFTFLVELIQKYICKQCKNRYYF